VYYERPVKYKKNAQHLDRVEQSKRKQNYEPEGRREGPDLIGHPESLRGGDNEKKLRSSFSSRKFPLRIADFRKLEPRRGWSSVLFICRFAVIQRRRRPQRGGARCYSKKGELRGRRRNDQKTGQKISAEV